MRFHFVGIGSIGSLVSHNLRRRLIREHEIYHIHKNIEDFLKAAEIGNKITVKSNGMPIVSSAFKGEVLPPMKQHELASPVARKYVKDSPIESLFVTTKAHQVLGVIRGLLPRLSPRSTIVLLHNGMGVLEELFVHVFTNPAQRPHFILASNTHGAHRTSFGTVNHAGIGSIEFGIVPNSVGRDYEATFKSDPHEGKGSLTDIASPEDSDFDVYRSLRNTVAALLLMEDLQCVWKPIAQVELAMRRKVVVNSVINPLTALMGCRNGQVFDAPGGDLIRSQVCQEASKIFASQTKQSAATWLEELAHQGVDISTVSLGRLPLALTRTRLEAECIRVAEVTKMNISSMLADIRRGRTTEIDYMNGYLSNLAETYNVKAPTIATLRNLVLMRGAIPMDN